MLSAPTSTAPAASSRSISGESCSAEARSRLIFEPARVGRPFTSNRFFTANGTPASGPTARPAARAASISRAFARARSAVTAVNALSCLSRASISASAASVTASAVVCPVMTASAMAAPETQAGSNAMPLRPERPAPAPPRPAEGIASTSAATFSVTSRLARIAGFQAGSMGRLSARAAALMKSSSGSDGVIVCPMCGSLSGLTLRMRAEQPLCKSEHQLHGQRRFTMRAAISRARPAAPVGMR